VEAKDCGRNIYFPNAFTPGNDQLNDLYRPKVFGRLTQYQIRIYNRIGQLVFESNDPAAGWDGNYKGRAQSSSSFTWYAIYRFAGAEEGVKMQKGTVTLIR
jgi:gliding motility-associated-like protein